MSFAALGWACKCDPGSASRKVVLFALADRHNDEVNGAYPSVAWVAKFTSLNRKTIITCLADLERLGFISDSGERRGDTKQIKLYHLHLETVPIVEQSQKRNSSEKCAKQSQKRDTDTVRTSIPQKAKKPSSGARAKPKIPLPDNWQPRPFSPGTICAQIVSTWQPGRIERELSKFKDHHLKTGAMWADWDAAWRTWVQKAGDFERGSDGRGQQSDPLRGSRPSAALDMRLRAQRELEAERNNPAFDSGPRLALPSFRPS